MCIYNYAHVVISCKQILTLNLYLEIAIKRLHKQRKIYHWLRHVRRFRATQLPRKTDRVPTLHAQRHRKFQGQRRFICVRSHFD